jgi:hypothetical protein
MRILRQLKKIVDYGERIIKAGLEGAHSGWETVLGEKALSTFLSESVRNAWRFAAIGACIGVLGVYSTGLRVSLRSALAYVSLGSVLGCGAGFLWKCHPLFKSVISAALKGVGRVRDEHWLERNPIDYA